MKPELKHKIIKTVFISVVFIAFALMFWPFATSILLAGLFAFALHDVVGKMISPKLSRRWASLILIVAILVFIAAPLSFLTLTTINSVKDYVSSGIQNTSIFQWTVQLLHQLTDSMQSLGARFNIDVSSLPKAKSYLSEYSGTLGSYVTKFVTSIPHMGLSLIVFFLTLYYFLNEAAFIKNILLRFDLMTEPELNRLNAVIKRSSFRTLVAALLIASAQALVISVFAYFCGYTDFFLVFIISFVFSLIPVVGSGPVSIFLVLISFIQGNTEAGIAMFVAFIIASSLDNIIKPFILNGAGDDIHPIIALLALIGAILFYGAPGILLGPVITQLAYNILSIMGSEEKSGENEILSDL